MQVQNLKPEACYKMVVTDETSAKKCLFEMVKYLGTGFHADTLGGMYVDRKFNPTFEKFECEFYDSNLNSIHEIFGDEIHTLAMGYWHELGMITNEEYEELGGFMVKVNSQKALEDVLGQILGAQSEADDSLCSTVYSDLCTGDSVIIRWMEADGNSQMHVMIDFLDKELFERTGRHFNMCNNSPTDGSLLVFWEEINDEPWNRFHHVETFIELFNRWCKDPAEFAYLKEWRVQFETLDDAMDRCCTGPVNLREFFNPDEEIWAQIMDWNRNGFPKEI